MTFPEIIIEKNETPERCKICGGRCCKKKPCEMYPQDIFGTEEPTVERLKEFLSTDLYQIDWWEGDIEKEDDTKYEDELPQIYFIRPREIEGIHMNFLYDPMFWGRCIFLTEIGCMLTWEDRPTCGKSLECSIDKLTGRPVPFDCDYTKEGAVREWRKIQYLFENIKNRKLEHFTQAIMNYKPKKEEK